MMAMNWVQTKSCSVLSVTLLGALLLCHIVGGACLMLPQSVMGATTIQDSPVGHTMAAEHTCSDLLTSSAKQLDSPNIQCAVLPEAFSVAAALADWGSNDQVRAPPKLGVPLYTLFSTLRI